MARHQKHDISYERFPRDAAELIEIIERTADITPLARSRAAKNSSSRKLWVYASAALLIAVGIIAQLAGAPQNSADNHDEIALKISETAYRITVLDRYYDLSSPTRVKILTGVMVKEPHLIMTADPHGDGKGIFDKADTNGTLIWVCEESPNPNQVAKIEKQFQEKSYNKQFISAEQPRFNAVTEKRKQKTIDSIQNRIRTNSAFLAEREICLQADVRNFHTTSSLVLLELRNKALGHMPTFNIAQPNPGDRVVAVGYSRSLGAPTESKIDPDIRRIEVPSDKLRYRLFPSATQGKVMAQPSEIEDRIFHTARIADGGWGGPLLNQCGDVLGFNTGISKSSEIFVAASTRALVSFAQLNGFSLDSTTRKCR